MMETSFKMETILEVLTNIGYNLKDAGSNYRARPIYRDSDNGTVLSIDKNTGKWYDFKECIGGPFEELVKLSLNLKNSDEAKTWLQQQSFQTHKTPEKPKVNSTKIYSKDCLSKLKRDNSYWNGRGISSETLEKFSGGLASAGKMIHRYVFPIFNSKGEIVGFSGRDVLTNSSEDRPKWKIIGKKDSFCFPLSLNSKIIQEKKEIIIVEGIGCVLKLWDCGVKNAVCLFGLNLGASLLKFMLKVDPDKIIIATNNEESGTGNSAAVELSSELMNYFDAKQVKIILPLKKDFAEMSSDEIKKWSALT